MKLQTEDKILIGGGAVASGMALVYALSSVKAPSSRSVLIYLTLNVSNGGATIPVAGTYEYYSTGKVILKAVPNLNYVFNGWFKEGRLLSSNLILNYNLTESVVISASFVREGQPILIPSYITPFQKTKAVLLDNWRLYKTASYLIGIFDHDNIHFLRNSFVSDTVQFKLCDKNGNGIPNQRIAVYTDNMPDSTLYGNLLMADARNLPPVGPIHFVKHQLGNPLYLITDVNGTVEALCAYIWEEPITGLETGHDYISTLGRSGKLKAVAAGFGSTWVLPIWDQIKSPPYIVMIGPIPVPIATGWNEWQLLADPIYRTINSVHAYWVDDQSLFNMGVCSADCNIKMMSSTTNIPYQ